jgi:hypothetical protein
MTNVYDCTTKHILSENLNRFSGAGLDARLQNTSGVGHSVKRIICNLSDQLIAALLIDIVQRQIICIRAALSRSGSFSEGTMTAAIRPRGCFPNHPSNPKLLNDAVE